MIAPKAGSERKEERDMLKKIMRDGDMTAREKMTSVLYLLAMMIYVPVVLALPAVQKWNSLLNKYINIRNSTEMVEVCIDIVLIVVLGIYAMYSWFDTIVDIVKAIDELLLEIQDEKWLI